MLAIDYWNHLIQHHMTKYFCCSPWQTLPSISRVRLVPGIGSIVDAGPVVVSPTVVVVIGVVDVVVSPVVVVGWLVVVLGWAVVSVVAVVGPSVGRTESVHGGVGMLVPSRQSSGASPIRQAARHPGPGHGVMYATNSCGLLSSINSWSPTPCTQNTSLWFPTAALTWPELCKKTAHSQPHHILPDDHPHHHAVH